MERVLDWQIKWPGLYVNRCKFNMNNFSFRPLIEHREKTFFTLLKQSYAGCEKVHPDCMKGWLNDWKTYDDEIFKNPNTVGCCGFVTYLSDVMIGFASWDPRKFPTGLIGHNCILPQYRGKGYGRDQINEIVNRLKKLFFTKILASTLDHDFFSAAQKMYHSCGFVEMRRFSAENNMYKIIDYEKSL